MNAKDFGALVQACQGIRFIPEILEKRVRMVYIRTLQNIISNKTCEDLWKKMFLLPTVLLVYNSQDAKSIKINLEKRLSVLESGAEWTFTLKDFIQTRRRLAVHDTDGDAQLGLEAERRCRQVSGAMRVGNLSKAYATLISDSGTAPLDQVSKVLHEKNPAPSPEVQATITPELWDRINSVKLSGDERVKFSTESLLKSIKNKKKGVSHGFDKLTWEILQQLVGREPDQSSDQVEFIQLLAKVLSLIANGDMPDEVAPALRDNHIMGVGVKVRPVLLCNTLRKLVTGLLLESTREKVAVMFDGIQYSSMKNGVEHVIHSLRAHMDTSDDDLFLADAVNAFNISNRTMGLGHLVDHFPSLVPMMRQMYGSNATLWLRGLDQVIEQISMQTGWQQGDVAGTFLYCVTTLPFHKGMQNLVSNHNGKVFAFVDDTKVKAPFRRMCETIRYMDTEGLKYGYQRHRAKGTYLLGRCRSLADAKFRKEFLVEEFGMDPTRIQIHPDNIQESGDEDEYKLACRLYGAESLGGLIGSKAFVEDGLTKKLEELNHDADRLIAHPNVQERMLLMQYCFNQKPNHLLRTTAPYYAKKFVKQLEKCQQRIVAASIETNIIGNTVWAQMKLPIPEGGLGLRSWDSVSRAAYLASVIEVQESIRRAYPKLDDALNQDSDDKLPWFIRDIRHAIEQVHSKDATVTGANVLTFTGAGQESLQSILTSKLESGAFDTLVETVQQDKARVACSRPSRISMWVLGFVQCRSTLPTW